MLAEEGEKLYNLIAKGLLDEIVSNYPVNNRSSPYWYSLTRHDTKDFPLLLIKSSEMYPAIS